MYKITLIVTFITAIHTQVESLPTLNEKDLEPIKVPAMIRIGDREFPREELPKQALDFYLLMENTRNGHFMMALSANNSEYVQFYQLGERIHGDLRAEFHRRKALERQENKESESEGDSVFESLGKLIKAGLVRMKLLPNIIEVEFHSNSIN